VDSVKKNGKTKKHCPVAEDVDAAYDDAKDKPLFNRTIGKGDNIKSLDINSSYLKEIYKIFSDQDTELLKTFDPNRDSEVNDPSTDMMH
jgi:hypothetical protein